jgi:hypothetical protein
MRASDRRDSYRFRVDRGTAVVRLAEGPAIEVQDLSGSGGCLIMKGELPGGETPLAATIELDSGERFPTQLQIVRRRSRAQGQVEVGARFAGLSRQALAQLSSFIVRQHVRSALDPARLLETESSLAITNPVFINNLFAPDPDSPQRMMYVIDGQVRLPVHLLVDGHHFRDGQRMVQARFAGDAARLVPGHAYTFVLAGPEALAVFESTCVRQRGKEVFIAVPTLVRQKGFRESPRVALPAGHLGLIAAHPRVPHSEIAAPVTDVAGRGICFIVPAGSDGLFPGDRLSSLQLQLPGGVSVQASGVIRSLRPRGESDQLSCGVELSRFATADDAVRWNQFVFRHTHPDLADGSGRAGEAWKVLEESRYVDLWVPVSQQARIRGEFIQTWAAPSAEVGQELLLAKEQRTIGLSAGSLAYPGTWILHHLGVAASESGRDTMNDASELIRGLLTRLRESASLEHFVIYAELGKRWNDRLYADFARRYAQSDKLIFQPSRVYRRDTRAPALLEVKPDDPVEIRPASPALWSALARHLRTASTRLEQRAYAFEEGRIDLDQFSNTCAAHGYERQRQALFALIDGQPVATLLAETGGEGVNVFGLMNTCRIIMMRDCIADISWVRHRLLAAAVAHYRAAGKRTFLLFDDEGDQDARALGFDIISPALRWLAHRDVIPVWAAYLKQLLTARTARAFPQPEREAV